MTTPVKDETKRQTVILLFSAVGTVVTVYLVYYFTKPDAFKIVKMRVALWLKHFAEHESDRWSNVATQAATIYNREKA